MTPRWLVPAVLEERAHITADGHFVECAGLRRTFGEMRDQADRIAAGLAKLGVTKGERVATILPNTIEHVDVIFACARIGAIHVPVNVFLKGEFLRYQLADCEPKVVIADDDGASAVKDIGRSFRVIDCTDIPKSDDRPPDVKLARSDTMAIIYTSGTTGMPKGCMLPYGYHVQSDNSLLEYRESDVLYTALPLFHGWARGMLFAALHHGMTLHLDADFSPKAALERMRETGATVFSAVGAMGMAMLAMPPSDEDRENALRVAFMIPFPPDKQAEFTNRFGPRVQSQMYGQTETGAITFTRLAETGKPGTVGRAAPSYDVSLSGDGEVLVRPKQPDVMYTGYWRKPDETSVAMRDGWHHTGDLATIDDDGFVTFVDRKKDAIRRRGENVSSAQLEAGIESHPRIAECAVVAVASDMTEDDIKACIVLGAGETISAEDLFAFLAETLPYFAVPRYVEIVDALPKTATARVQKHVLRDNVLTPATWDFESLGFRIDRDARRR